MKTRIARRADLDVLVTMQWTLWPEGSIDELRDETAAILAGAPPSTLPLVYFVAEENDRVVGFAQVGLRSHADGCDSSHAVGFLEGWYVEPALRKRGIGGALVSCAESWSREQGCSELASDTWLESVDSQKAHSSLGFEVVGKCVNYRKRIKREAK